MISLVQMCQFMHHDIFQTFLRPTGQQRIQINAVNFYYRSELNNEAKCAFVEFFYKQELAGRGEQLLQAWEKKMGVRHTGLKVHRMKTRWGSCSAKGGLNFSWRLLCAPPEAMDYVVVHELAHLIEFNHSSRFWAIVEGILPDYKARRQSLKEVQESLLRQGW